MRRALIVVLVLMCCGVSRGGELFDALSRLRGGDRTSSVQEVPSLGVGVVPLQVAAPASLPELKIVSPATWDCPHCPAMRNQDWSGFAVTFEKRDGLSAYPCAEWVDSRGVTRRLYGKYSPDQVRWSMRQTGVEAPTTAEAAPTSHAEVARVLAILRPQSSETFVDYGCGDARWCIAATRTYGCRSVGVEIDSERAAAARAAVAASGLSDRIEIIEGDATKVDVPAQVGVCYLWPETLELLKPKLMKLDRFASMQHHVEGVAMAQNGDAWVYRKPQPVVQRAGAVWGGRMYSGPVCNSRNCAMCNAIRRQLGYR